MNRFCHFLGMSPEAPQQDKESAILAAAFAVFAQYGYRRTAMEDIAKVAGISRSALYLYWRNKEDIFRSLALRHFAKALTELRAVLAQPEQSAEIALTKAFHAKDGSFMEMVLASPHGIELLDQGFAIGSDIVAEAEAQFVEVLAHWLERRGLPDGIGSAPEVAAAMFAALKGLKLGATNFAAYQASQARLARIFARAIS
jgi:AcrR family transcriptional regulator